MLQRGPFVMYGNKTFAQETYFQAAEVRRPRGKGYAIASGIFDEYVMKIPATASQQALSKSGKLLM